MQAFDDRPAGKPNDFQPERRAFCAHAPHFVVVRRLETGHEKRAFVRDIQRAPHRMGAVVKGILAIAPVVFFALRVKIPGVLAVVQVLGFQILRGAEIAGFDQPAHFQHLRKIAVIFRIAVNAARFFHRFHQFHALFQRFCEQNLAQHRNAAL